MDLGTHQNRHINNLSEPVNRGGGSYVESVPSYWLQQPVALKRTKLLTVHEEQRVVITHQHPLPVAGLLLVVLVGQHRSQRPPGVTWDMHQGIKV